MIETLILSITSFIGTNIDDMFINTLLFSEAKTRSDRINIIIGKYIGIGALTALGVLGAFGLHFIPQKFIGLLGFVPIGLGIKEIVSCTGSGETQDSGKTATGSIINTAVITMANGADNIGVYIPLFAGFDIRQIVIAVCVFIFFIAVWCFLGNFTANLPAIKKAVSKYKKILVPTVYMALGAYILIKNFT